MWLSRILFVYLWGPVAGITVKLILKMSEKFGDVDQLEVEVENKINK